MEAERDLEAPKLCVVGARGYLRGMERNNCARKDLRGLEQSKVYSNRSSISRGGHEQGIFRGA